MPTPSDPKPPADAARQALARVRLALLRLHKTLIDSERERFERERGRLSNGQFLQLLIQDDHFAWLRPYSALIVEIDEARSAEEPLGREEALGFVARVRNLVSASDDVPDERPETLEAARVRDPAVLGAHLELMRAVEAALSDEPGG